MRVVFACLALVAGAAACTGGSSTPTCDAPVATTTIKLADFAFDPGCAGVSSGATLTLTNAGGAPHSYTVKDTSVNVQVDPGQSQTIVLTDVAPGTYTVVCTYHPQMKGALKVG